VLLDELLELLELLKLDDEDELLAPSAKELELSLEDTDESDDMD